MRTKNLTPYVFGRKHVSRIPRRREMAFFVRAKLVLAPGRDLVPFEFPELPAYAKEAGPELQEGLNQLAQGNVGPETYADEDDDRKGQVIYPGDFADWKAGADVMLRGAFHAPEKRKVREGFARFSVGGWSKTLRVVGPRVWVDRLMGGKATEPLEFDSVPIDWEHAWGGPDSPSNPVGTGLASERLGQIERADGDRAPASFAPINPSWPISAAKLGKNYGPAWEKTRAPYFADDFDPDYLRPVPPDQRLSTFLRGDETIRFENLHPDQASFSVELPRHRIRAFVRFDDGRAAAIPMNLDTLFADLVEGALYLTWRGHCAVREDDLSDVAFSLIAMEHLADPPAPDAHYLAELERFAEDPVGLKDAFPDGFLEAAKEAEEREDRDDPPVPPADAIAALKASKFGQMIASVAAKQGIPLEQVWKALDRTLATEDGRKALGAAPATGKARQVPGGLLLEPGAKPKVGGAEQIERALAESARGDKLAGGAPRARPIDPRLKEMFPGFREPGAPPREQPGPGANLAGQDLSGRDLSGLDLTGANLEVVDLTRANLRGTKLAGAVLTFARLTHADATGADFAGADVRGADFTKTEVGSATFDRARIDQAKFHKSKLVGASFRHVTGKMAAFTECDLERASFQSAEVLLASFEKCALAMADFGGASLTRTMFMGCEAKGVSFAGARGEHLGFRESKLHEARFTRFVGALTSYLHCELDRADFSLAVLRRALLRELIATGAKFIGADLRDASFYKANLGGSSFQLANLMNADLRKTVLTDASFLQANLFNAKLIEAHGTNVELKGANVKRANLQRSEVTRR